MQVLAEAAQQENNLEQGRELVPGLGDLDLEGKVLRPDRHSERTQFQLRRK